MNQSKIYCCRCSNQGSMICEGCQKKHSFTIPSETKYYCPHCFQTIYEIQQTCQDYNTHFHCTLDKFSKILYFCSACHTIFCYCIREQNPESIKNQLQIGVPKTQIKLNYSI